MTAPDSILRLVERFDANRRAYTDAKYNETQLRREFLDPFFKALGWDVDNAQGYAEAYKDVIHEATLTVEGSAKAPDYAFRIGGKCRFFVEAKKPSVDIEGGVGPAFHLRRYQRDVLRAIEVRVDSHGRLRDLAGAEVALCNLPLGKLARMAGSPPGAAPTRLDSLIWQPETGLEVAEHE